MTSTVANGVLSTASEAKPLFSLDLISPTVSAALPEDYILRPLERSDYSRGFLDVLRVLTTVGDITPESWNTRYDWMEKRSGEYFVLCVVDTKREEGQSIVGTGTVLVERKFIHELGLVGHIEDIAVAKDQQGKKLGLRIIQALDFVAESVGCYKVRSSMIHTFKIVVLTDVMQTILDCSEANEGFYVKCNFRRAGLEMARYYDMSGKSRA
jgi:glucosamine-phosphate N-acetyltransferase